MIPNRDRLALKHNNKGNCWNKARPCRRCGKGFEDTTCDICHTHDGVRGDCDECPRCEACDKEAESRLPRRR
jgi:hypothetical protein